MIPSTNTLLIAIVGAIATVVSTGLAVIAPLVLRRLGEIHVLVNSNMTALKEQVTQLEKVVGKVTIERDAAEKVVMAAEQAADATHEALLAVEEHKND